jgi:hypothetical protein
VLVFLVVPGEPSLNLFETSIDPIKSDLLYNAAVAVSLLEFNCYLLTRHDRSQVLAGSQSKGLLSFRRIDPG